MGLLSRPTSRMQAVLPVDTKRPLPAPASPVLVSDKSNPVVAVKDEDSDVEMADAPQSAPSSRNSPIGGSNVKPSEGIANGSLEATIKQEPRKISVGAAAEAQAPRKPSVGGAAALGINLHGKRPREGSIKEEGTIKQVRLVGFSLPRFHPLSAHTFGNLYHLSQRYTRSVVPSVADRILQAAPLKGKTGTDLDAALAAHQAARPAPARPQGGAAGVLPPRRKQPADPFIQRKPARRR